MIGWLLGAAFAHGPAPAGLEVLAWSTDAACDAAAAAPALVRTNVGLATWNGATYDYGCPARWGDAETALVASSSSGQRLLIAGTSRVFTSDDGGCTAAEVELPANDTPVTVAVRPDGTGLLLTRDFAGGTGALWSVTAEALLLARWDDFFPDELLLDGETVWLSGARPSPALRPWTGGALGEGVALPEAEDLQRLALRTLHDGVFVLHATRLDGRYLWRAGEGGPGVIGGPATSIHGPVRFDGADVALFDGVLWRDAGEGLAPTDQSADWTCLREADGIAYVCSLEATSVLEGLDPITTTPVFSLDQLGPPAPACDDAGGSCELDWLHFGGESGWYQTEPADCPLGDRTPIAPDTDDTDDTDDGVAPEGCGCAAVGSGPGAAFPAFLAALLGRRGRFRRSEVHDAAVDPGARGRARRL